MKIYIYLILILFMLLIIYEGFRNNLKYAPSKIKMICIGIFTAMALRYTALLIFFIVRNIRYLYLVKPLYFLNFLCIPIGALITIYVLMRNDRIKFSYMFPLSAVLILFYGYLIYKCPVRLNTDIVYGYYMEFINSPYIYIGYMLINMFFIIFSVNIYNANIDKKGIMLVIISSILLIVEVIMYLIGKGIFTHLIIGDMLWMITLNYAILKLNRSIVTNY